MSSLKEDDIELGRRQHERFAVDLEAELTAENGTFGVVTRDLSRGGVCCVAPDPVPVGSSFRISLSLVLGENTFSEPLELEGAVIWCTPQAGGFQIGASFSGLSDETREYLQIFLNFLADGLRLQEEDEGDEDDQENEDDQDDPNEKGLFA